MRKVVGHRRASSRPLLISLPDVATTRWLASHKAAVIIAVRAGEITFSEASERYRLSHEELTAWEVAFDEDGMAGLEVKYLAARSKKGS